MPSVYILVQSSPMYAGWLLPSYSIHCRIHLLLPLADRECFFSAMGSLKAECFRNNFSCVCFPLVSIHFKFDSKKGFSIFLWAREHLITQQIPWAFTFSALCPSPDLKLSHCLERKLFMKTSKALQAESDNDTSNEQGRLSSEETATSSAKITGLT